MNVAEALRALRERWWVLLAAAAFAALVAFAYTKMPFVEPRWRSSVWIQAQGRFDYGNTLALEKQLRPLAEQVQQLDLMRQVSQNLHLDLPAEKMLGQTKANPVQDSSQVRVDYEDADPRRAEQVALEMADVYTQQHNAQQQSALREERVILSVLDRPSTATLVWPQTRIIVPVAALLGVIVAAAVVLALQYLDDTLKSPEDVQTLGLPLIGLVPRHTPARPASGGEAAPVERRPAAPVTTR